MTLPSVGPSPERQTPFRFLIALLWTQRRTMLVAGALSAVGAGAALTQPFILNRIVTDVQAGRNVTGMAWGMGALLLLLALLTALQQFLLQRAGEGVVLAARRSLISRLLRLPVIEFDRRRSGDLIARVSSDTMVLRLALAQTLMAAVGGVLTFAGAIIAMIRIDALLVGLTVGVLAAAGLLTVGLARGVRSASEDAQAAMGRLTAALERSIRAIRTIRAANAVDAEEERTVAHAVSAYHAGVRLAGVSAAVEPMATVATQASVFVVLGVGGYRVAAGAIPLADLVSFLLYLFLLVMPLGQVFAAVSAVNTALGAVQRITEITSVPAEGTRDEGHGGTRVMPDGHPVDGRVAVEFRHVSFGYRSMPGDDRPLPEGSGRPALCDVSFAVPVGAKIALVGPSGAGKSTTLNLIERFYDPDEGQILVFGLDARSLTHEQVRAGIGYVEQDAPVLAGTLWDNLTVGAPQVSAEDCARVLKAVNLADLAERSERGLYVELGDAGVALSGGERQRLAIARALLRSPRILLLDESTSNLDGRNEHLAREAVAQLSGDCTVIVVAHRLATVVDADLIVVFDAGRVVARGRHEELVASNPLYRELARHQLLV